MNAATANVVPPTRSRASAWLDTSIAVSVMPRSAITASSACRSGASGVVRPPGTGSSPMNAPTVPISPAARPAARRPARIRNVVVVFPLVPVTPAMAR